jgi:hypothetical protein
MRANCTALQSVTFRIADLTSIVQDETIATAGQSWCVPWYTLPWQLKSLRLEVTTYTGETAFYRRQWPVLDDYTDAVAVFASMADERDGDGLAFYGPQTEVLSVFRTWLCEIDGVASERTQGHSRVRMVKETGLYPGSG